MRPSFEIGRRAALKILAGGLTVSLANCGKPFEEIVPYVDMPERLVPGEPMRFATTLPLSGYGRGVLATSIDGRPIKIEGNPRHPASLGATDVFAEAAIMSLYDPDRSKAARHNDDIVTWEAFSAALRMQMERERARQGTGLRIVSNRVTSPTLLRQIGDLLKQYPQARWVRYESISDDAVVAGATEAYGRPLVARPRIADAAVMLALDADPLGPGPDQIANAHAFARRRSREALPFLRLYAVEPDWSLTGANADHRLALCPVHIRNVALAIAATLRGEQAQVGLTPDAMRFVQAVTADLSGNKGRALVMAGPRQPAQVHALVHWINAQLQAPIELIELVDPQLQSHADALHSFAEDLDKGHVETLIVLGANPAYDTPPGLNIGRNLARVSFSAHLGLHDDETGARCQWHLPLSHPLECWSDLRATNGTASIAQPLIRSLYDSRSAHEVIALFAGAASPVGYELIRQTWANQTGTDNFEDWWRRTLHDGVVANSAAQPASTRAPTLPNLAPARIAQEFTLLLKPDASVWDGCYANNALLQECPQPLTKDVWGNSVALSRGDAARLKVGDGDIVRIAHNGMSVNGPVRIQDGQADGVVSIAIGYGRERAGAIGNGIGFNAYALRTLDAPWRLDGITLSPTGEQRPIPTMQDQHRLEGEDTDLYPILSLVELAQGKRPTGHADEEKPSLYAQMPYDTYAWAMVIDTSLCIGCNACVVACQAENNVPVVGPEEAARGRDMHWLRIDTYVVHPKQPPGFQPVPCMHCEQAPCEPVCPVAASVHDGEGLNVQVYNRCIGTRFCQANCPYKVRRFNWFGYADGQQYADLGDEVTKAINNPDVTVRTRGVMEKCTYCVQRISRARRSVEKESRSMAEGEVVTACQAACPTRAIHFGDRNKKDSRVNALRQEPQHYALLGHLGTRPRTTYMARLRNPNPALQEPQT
jgi:molybdopterin-containing oxidoreductase family iron-sulfur binding subunit